jgi:hypothetical protein
MYKPFRVHRQRITRHLAALGLAVVTTTGCQNQAQPEVVETGLAMPEEEIPAQVQERMAAQEAAWSQGDVEAFMALAYWPSDSLLFVGSKGLTLGYQTTLTNYKSSYPTGAAMGTLTFENLKWKRLSIDTGYLVGKWHLERGEAEDGTELEDLAGHYSLVWRWFGEDAGWLIIADHSS